MTAKPTSRAGKAAKPTKTAKTASRTVKKAAKPTGRATKTAAKTSRTASRVASKATNKAAKTTAKTGKTPNKKVLKELFDLGDNVYRDIRAGRYPSVDVPARIKGNIIFDEGHEQWILGDKTTNRSAGNMAGARPLAQLMWLTAFAQKALTTKTTHTKRSIYYAAYNSPITSYTEQAESDALIEELEVILGRPREDFGVTPGQRALAYGDIDVEYTRRDGTKTRGKLNTVPDGTQIGHSLATAKFVRHDLRMVIVGEKDDVLVRCMEDGICETYKAMAISTNGQATRDTRHMLRRLASELGLPVYVVTDADPWGMHIASVIVGGSTQSAHLRGLAVPKARWLGVWATEMPKLHPKAVLDFKDVDINRCKSLATDPRYASGIWKRELSYFTKHKKKAEIEALGATDMFYLTNEYIPEKLKQAAKGRLR